jgi:hypothetical protein
MIADGRQRKGMIILGRGGSGKSTLARWIASKYPLQIGGHPTQVIVGDPGGNWARFGMGEFPEEAFRSPHKGMEKWIARITNNGKGPKKPGGRVGRGGALIIPDDADMYLLNNRGPSNWNPFWMIYRHLFLDWILISHDSQGIPKLAFTMATKIVLLALDEPGCKNYLRQTNIGNAVDMIPSDNFRALVYDVQSRRLHLEDYTQLIPKPTVVDAALMKRCAMEREYRQRAANG